MERLPEQIVDWHNRHPLARRITVGDVHTIGVVALPFVRASAQAGGVVEPVLTDVVSAFDDLENAPRASRMGAWRRRLTALAAWLPGAKPRTQWRAFSEKFLRGLSPAQIERFALAYGYAEPPATPETKPWRVVVIDETLAAAHSGWPFELYLMSAGIDVGNAHTRVLTGRGIPSQITGRRLWDPIRLGALAAVLAVLIAGATYALWPHPAAPPAVEAPAAAAEPITPAASAAPPAVPAEPASAAASATVPDVASPASSAAAHDAPASGAAPEADESASQPDIRPHLVQRTDGIVRPPLWASKSSGPAAEKSADKAGEKAPDKSPDKAGDKAAEKSAEKANEKGGDKAAAKPAEPADTRLSRMAEAPGKLVVALVGPPGSKAEAEAQLKKMQAALVGVHSHPESLQGEVVQTPDGWRATVWPFPSREQAQLINATLVARGLKTKAVNF